MQDYQPIIEFDGVRYPIDKYFINGDHVVARVRGNRWQTLKEDEYFRVRMVDVWGDVHRINPLPEMITERKRRQRREREERERKGRLIDPFTGKEVRQEKNTNKRNPFA